MEDADTGSIHKPYATCFGFLTAISVFFGDNFASLKIFAEKSPLELLEMLATRNALSTHRDVAVLNPVGTKTLRIVAGAL